MRVRLNIGLDFDGNHTFEWQESNGPGAVDISSSTLSRWSTEREAFTVAYLRWKRVVEEIEETLYRCEPKPAPAPVPRIEQPALAYATASAPGARRAPRK